MPQAALNFSSFLAERTRDFTGREWLFTALDRWLVDPAAPRLFILAGEPGIGKTAIAGRLLQLSDGAAEPPAGCGRLGCGLVSAVHICSARNGGWIAPESFVRSMSTQLAEQYPAFARGVQFDPRIRIEQQAGTVTGAMIGVQIANYYAESPEALFDSLVRQPLHALCESEDAPEQIVLLVDGLDESLQFTGRTTIVRLLAMCHDLPGPVRLVLTTRPVDAVLEPFRPLRPFVLHADSAENQDDVQAYARVRLRGMGVVHLDEAVDRLAARGHGNFLVVSKVLDAVARGELDLDDARVWPTDLQELYAWFLDRLTQGDRTLWRSHYRPVLSLLAAAREPVSAEQVCEWVGLKRQAVRDAFQDLRELLDLGQAERYRLYHESVADFLAGQYAGQYQIDVAEAHAQIAASYTTRYGNDHAEWSECDAYGLRHLPAHLAAAGEAERPRALLLDFDWLQAKLDATDVSALIGDYDLTGDDGDLRLVQGALRLSAHVLVQNRHQLAGQLLGRLLSFEGPAIKALLAQAQQWRGAPWLRPLTASLTPPGGPLVRTLTGHMAGVTAVTLSVDGRRAVSASWDKTLIVWDVERGTALRRLRGHIGPVMGVVLSADGWRVVSASDDQTLIVWDLERGVPLRTLTGHIGVVTAVALSADGRRAVSTSWDKTLIVWDVERGTALRTLTGHTGRVMGVALSADGRRAISASWDETLIVWDVERGTALRTLTGHTGRVMGVALSADGRRAVSASDDSTLIVWDVERGTALRRLTGHTSMVEAVVLSVDGQQAVSASYDQTLVVWNLERGVALHRLTGHTGPVTGVAMSADGRRVISCAQDQTLIVWDAESGATVRTPAGHTSMVEAVALSADGRRAVSASDDSTLIVWDVERGAALRTLTGHVGPVMGVALSADGRRAVSAAKDWTLTVWDVERGAALRRLTGHNGAVTGVTLSADGGRAISSSYDQTLILWDVERGAVLRRLTGHTAPVTSVALSTDGGQAISSSYDQALILWDVERGAALRKLTGHTGRVYGVALSADGRRAVSAAQDQALIMWDLERGAAPCKLTGHTNAVNSVALSADGRWVVSASDDKTLVVWDLERGVPLATFNANGAVRACAMRLAGDDARAWIVVAGDAAAQVHFLRLEGASHP